MIVTLATTEDSHNIWVIRYSHAVNSISLNQRQVLFEEHDRWFKQKYGEGAPHFCFVLKDDAGGVLGYCRLDQDSPGIYTVSIALTESVQGKGLGSKLLNESLAEAGLSGEVLATVKKDNLSSQRLFEKNGFRLKKDDGVVMIFIKKL